MAVVVFATYNQHEFLAAETKIRLFSGTDMGYELRYWNIDIGIGNIICKYVCSKVGPWMGNWGIMEGLGHGNRMGCIRERGFLGEVGAHCSVRSSRPRGVIACRYR